MPANVIKKKGLAKLTPMWPTDAWEDDWDLIEWWLLTPEKVSGI
jgi:hypothetical protein